MSTLKLDVDQIAELKRAFRRNGWTNREIKKLCKGKTLGIVRGVLYETYIVVNPTHVIDLDASPFVPDGSRLRQKMQANTGGEFVWDPKHVRILPAEKWMKAGDFIAKLKNQKPFTAILLDFLLKHPVLAPTTWFESSSRVIFPGTSYQDEAVRQYVRFLGIDGGQLYGGRIYLTEYLDHTAAAALRV